MNTTENAEIAASLLNERLAVHLRHLTPAAYVALVEQAKGKGVEIPAAAADFAARCAETECKDA